MTTKPWRQYQTDVAALLGELGFATAVEDTLTSSRGVTHKVDVTARRLLAGVEVLWVVECKLWHSAVPKEKVGPRSPPLARTWVPTVACCCQRPVFSPARSRWPPDALSP